MYNTQLVNPQQNASYQGSGFPYGMSQGPFQQPQSILNQPYTRYLPNSQVYVSDFEETMTGSILFDYFQRFGRVVQFIFPINQANKRPKGFAFVTYQNPADAQLAIKEANHAEILKNPIRVLSYKTNFKDIPKEANLFLNNLSENIKEKDIEDWFRENQIGGVISCKILYEKGKSKGYGYVQLDNVKSCDEFLISCNGLIKIKDQEVLVQRFTPKSQRPTMKNNLYLKNLPEPDESNSEESIKEQLLEKFQQFGKISSALVKKTQPFAETGKTSYYAFICFQDDEKKNAVQAAQDAKNALNDTDIFGTGFATEIHYFENKSERMKNMKNNLFTKNLKEEVKESDVYRVFSQFGVVIRYTVRRPAKNVKNFKTQYAMIQFANKEDAMTAMNTAHKNKEVMELYQNELVSLGPWQDSDTRKKVIEARVNASRFNKQLYDPSGHGMQQQQYQMPNPAAASMNMNPQGIYNQPGQLLGAPTVGNAGNQINPGMQGFNNYPGGFNQQMGGGMPQGQQSYMMGGRPKNMQQGGGRGKPVRPPQQNRSGYNQNNNQMNYNMGMNKVSVCFSD